MTARYGRDAPGSHTLWYPRNPGPHRPAPPRRSRGVRPPAGTLGLLDDPGLAYASRPRIARHAPSGADAQPWHYIAVTDPGLKDRLAGHFVRERHRRIELGMKFPSPNYRGMATAPGLIVVVADFRYVKAFPVLGDGSELDRMYQQNAERILLQSVAASTMAAHLAAAALGYAVWWVTAIGQEEAQQAIRPLLDVPDELSPIDIMCFGPPRRPPYKRWKKQIDEIIGFSSAERVFA